MAVGQAGHQCASAAVDHPPHGHRQRFGRDRGNLVAGDDDIGVLDEILVDAVEHVDVGKQRDLRISVLRPRRNNFVTLREDPGHKLTSEARLLKEGARLMSLSRQRRVGQTAWMVSL